MTLQNLDCGRGYSCYKANKNNNKDICISLFFHICCLCSLKQLTMSWDFIKGNLHEAYWSNYYCWLIEEKASVLWYSRFIYRHLLYILVKNKAFIRAQVAHALLLLREKFTDFSVCVIRYIFIRKLSHLTISSPFILKNQKNTYRLKWLLEWISIDYSLLLCTWLSALLLFITWFF